MTAALEAVPDLLRQGVEVAALALATIGALFVATRRWFRRLVAGIDAANAQVQNGHGGGPSLRDDIDTIIEGQRNTREDLVDLRRRVDDGFREVRGDIRTLQDDQKTQDERDAEISARVRHLEDVSPPAA